MTAGTTTNEIATLLRDCTAAGVVVVVTEAGTLACRGSKPPPALLARLKAAKPELQDYLKHHDEAEALDQPGGWGEVPPPRLQYQPVEPTASQEERLDLCHWVLRQPKAVVDWAQRRSVSYFERHPLWKPWSHDYAAAQDVYRWQLGNRKPLTPPGEQ